jgi:beta-1,4-mannosyltransferase
MSHKFSSTNNASQFWQSGSIYYLSLFLPIILNLLIFYVLFFEVEVDTLDTTGEYVLFALKFFWLTGAVVAVTNFVGLVWFGNPARANTAALAQFNRSGWPAIRLVVVFVSRGDNATALARSVLATETLLQRLNVVHRIDVVTDLPVADTISTPGSAVKFHLVPVGYTTINQAKWKARALHYVVEQHRTDEEMYDTLPTWVLHLDEESQLTESAVAGIAEFATTPGNQNRIGQGEIKYNAYQYGSNLILTWADSIRSGDDLGRFRFQYALFKRPLFGMHGSYILAPLAIEQQFGFDLGGRGSVTEDAYFALKCSEQGIKFGWVNGYIREQSPFTLMALIKQRRRWFSGLMMLSFDSEISLKTRLPLMFNTLLWSVAWIGPIVTIVTLILGGYFPIGLLIIAGLLRGF